ncbi:TPA: hypothetical protein N0F65_004907 [Lagenidium giganteum]|uniref:RWP-RK domain-containing protein n=1 Tax=Lagenidium giganteum TaxID=4803 RepID=A0AAV2YWT0_9STRA|nr:TPA: hypothetical protein N0F65_004907 [Lagenidium giganteum]
MVYAHPVEPHEDIDAGKSDGSDQEQPQRFTWHHSTPAPERRSSHWEPLCEEIKEEVKREEDIVAVFPHLGRKRQREEANREADSSYQQHSDRNDEPTTGILGARGALTNASKSITFDMLQPHFERPLQAAAEHFGICTTLLKKICRKCGINKWPYRKVHSLRKSIETMRQQVQYFDGGEQEHYVQNLRKANASLAYLLRTGNEPVGSDSPPVADQPSPEWKPQYNGVEEVTSSENFVDRDEGSQQSRRYQVSSFQSRTSQSAAGVHPMMDQHPVRTVSVRSSNVQPQTMIPNLTAQRALPPLSFILNRPRPMSDSPTRSQDERHFQR